MKVSSKHWGPAKNETRASISNDRCEWTQRPTSDPVWQLLNYWQTKIKLASILTGATTELQVFKKKKKNSSSGATRAAARCSYAEVLPEEGRARCGREHVLLLCLMTPGWSQGKNFNYCFHADCDCDCDGSSSGHTKTGWGDGELSTSILCCFNTRSD